MAPSAIAVGGEDVAAFACEDEVNERLSRASVRRLRNNAQFLRDGPVQRFLDGNDTAFPEHQRPGGEDRVSIARGAVLLCHADVIGVDNFRLNPVPETDLLQGLDRGLSVGSQFGFGDGDDPNFRRRQILQAQDLRMAAGRNPQRQHAGCVGRAVGQEAFAVELAGVFGVGGEKDVEGRAVFNLLRQLRG